ncbi:c-type cytochrome [Paenibacillus sp. MMS18-CY102]|uniref:c-type cytochrome n=1 Tax=Paenibacillus sp. MMS18-CY102 TaxID=2682849 RepID=UPI0013660689|nr:cytochrome c [Paenibacillus sp. MMS18-CY102]MWC30321.1 c-type cytochrome [Paenibacillus sp. MMS18-CY102]
MPMIKVAKASSNRFLSIAIFATLLTLAGCGSTTSKPSSLEGPAAAIELYNNSCISCHASDLSGKVGPDSDLRKVGSRMSKTEIANQITNGGDIMPPFKGKLSADEISALSDWLAARQ